MALLFVIRFDHDCRMVRGGCAIALRLLLPFLLLGALIAACGTGLDPDQCRLGDWRAIGMADGLEGRGPATLQQHARSCAEVGVAPDAAAYEAGRTAGLQYYCVPETAYEHGRRGLSFPAVCTGAGSAPLQEAHAFGRRYWDLGREIDSKRRSLRDDMSAGSLLISDAALGPAEIRSLQRERSRHAVWPPR